MLKEIEVEVTESQTIHHCNLCGMEADWNVFDDTLAFCKECAKNQLDLDVSAVPKAFLNKEVNGSFGSKKMRQFWYNVDISAIDDARTVATFMVGIYFVTSIYFALGQGLFSIAFGWNVAMFLLMSIIAWSLGRCFSSCQKPDGNWIKLSSKK